MKCDREGQTGREGWLWSQILEWKETWPPSDLI